jgi:hypothetical protein
LLLRHKTTSDAKYPLEADVVAVLGRGNDGVEKTSITSETRGHGTHSLPAIWSNYLADLLKDCESGTGHAIASASENPLSLFESVTGPG